jgi:type I restriction enzyme R subunit
VIVEQVKRATAIFSVRAEQEVVPLVPVQSQATLEKLGYVIVVSKPSRVLSLYAPFKGKAKVFCRSYAFLSSVISYGNVEWERLSILLNLLVPMLPAPEEEDLARGILESIDMDSYRVEKRATQKIGLEDKDTEIGPMPTEAGGRKPEPEMDKLSHILEGFNAQFGTLFQDTDRIVQRIREDIAPKVAEDQAFRNAKANTPHTARMAHDQALGRVMQTLLKDDMQVYKQFVENETFKRFVTDMVSVLTGAP